MERRQLLEHLVELAHEAGMTVRCGRAGVQSGACRVRGRVWLVLDDGDPLEERIDVVAAALREHAGELLAGRYLPPAVRARLEPPV